MHAYTSSRHGLRVIATDAYTRHKQLINTYLLYHKGSTVKLERDTSNDRNDYDIIRENHRFLWRDEDVVQAEKSWDMNLAKRYYDRLFKEYCLADLSKYKQNLYAMRWRVEKEVFSGKGQFECGNKHCKSLVDLSSWEVNFSYSEHGQKRNALVKLRLCPECSLKLNYHSTKRLIKKEDKKGKKHERKEDRDRNDAYSQSFSKHSFKRKNKKAEKSTKSSSEVFFAKIKTEPATEESTEGEKASSSGNRVWSGKSAALVEAERTASDELDEFIDDLLL